MAASKAATPDEYLAELPPERGAVLSAVRDVVRGSLPDGYRESMRWGMISYEIPLERYPDTYNGQPLSFAALAAQKNHYALYLSCVYQDAEEAAWLADEFARAGKRLDMGKSCLRFRNLDGLALDAVAAVIARTPPERFIARYEASRTA